MWTSSPIFENLTWSPKTSQTPAESPTPSETQTRTDPASPDEASKDFARFPAKVKERGERTGSIEICCGYAGLTAALADAGLEAIGVDWKGDRRNPQVPIITADLTTNEGQ